MIAIRIGALGGMLWLATAWASGQDAPVPASPPTEPPAADLAPASVETSPETPPEMPAAALGDEDAGITAFREQTIYVPYNRLKQVFERQGRGVFLPYEEFQQLWQQARESARRRPDERPPVAALIARIESEARVEQDVVRVDARLTIEILRRGWHEIPLRLADAALLSAVQGGQPARVLARPGEGYVLLVEHTAEGPRQLEVQLQYTRAFTKSPGQNQVSFQAPQAPVNLWRIRIPQAGAKVQIRPLIAATELAAPEGAAAEETVVQAFVGAASALEIDWTPKAEGAMGLEALASVQAEQQVTVDEGVLRTRAQLNYAISRAEMSALTIEVPADHRVLNVFDANVKTWTVQQEAQVQRISVELYDPAKSSQSITVELEKFSEDLLKQPVAAPVVKAAGVGRQQGIVVVRVAPTLRADVASYAGLLQLDSGELPPSLARGGWQFAYRYAALPFDLTLDVEKIEPLVRTRELVEAYVEPDRLSLDLLALFEIERAGLFQLELELPAGWEVRQVRGQAIAGAEAAAVDAQHVVEGEPRKLIVNLGRKAMGRVGLFVELQQRLDDRNLLEPTGQVSRLELAIPRVAPGKIERSTGRMIVYAPESLRVNPVETEGLQSIAPTEALEGMESARAGRFPLTREVLAFAYTGEAVALPLDVERRKPYITARQLLSARIESGVIQYEATFFYDIRYSGVKSLRLDVPAELADEIRNLTAATARDTAMNPQPDDVAAGGVAWSLAGDTELLGEVVLKFGWEKKIGELDVGGSVEEPLPYLRPRSVDRDWGQIVLAKAEMLDVRTAGQPEGLRPIDPQHDLMPGVAFAGAARAFEFHEPWKLTIRVTRYELVEVKSASVERAVARMEVTRSGQVAVQALYRLRGAGQRLQLALPPTIQFDTEPLRINGRVVALERGDQEEYFVPLVGVSAETPFLLEIRYTVADYRGRLELPDFPSDPAVQKVYICSYLPQEQRLLATGGPWTDESARPWYEWSAGYRGGGQNDAQLVGWVIEETGAANPFGDFATDGRLHVFSTLQPEAPPAGSLRLVTIHERWLHAIAFGLVLLLGLALLPARLPLKLAGLLLLVGGLLVLGVFAPLLARNLVGGALFTALLVVAALWLAWYAVRIWRYLAESFDLRESLRRTAATFRRPAAEADSPFFREHDVTAEIVPPPPAPDQEEGGSRHG